MTSQVQENKKLYGKWQPRTLYYWLARIGSKTTWTILTLVLFNIICYANTVDGYFLADDFIHVSYLYKVFNGHPSLLLENFWSNWMQTEGTQFYRPVISLTLAFDYLLWAQNAKGYHLSNLVYQILCSIGVFLVAKRIFITDLRGQPKVKKENQSKTTEETKAEIEESKDENEDQLVEKVAKQNKHGIARLSPDHVYTINFSALLAAVIFSVHPLHPEVVSWIIGRVDSVCTAAYLFSMWLFLVSIQSSNEKTKSNTLIASLVIFAIGLGSKEMAVTLPPSLVLLLLFFQTPVYGRAKSVWIRIANAFKATWHYWLILIAYFVIRTLSLGQLVGGYEGSIAEGFSNTLLERLISQQSILKVVFPLNMEVFSPGTKVVSQLRLIYSAIIGTFVLALLISRSKDTVIKSVIFTGLWFVLIMIPTIPVWNLTDSLQSSRFIYMGTVPLSILLALMVCPLSRYGRRVIRQKEKTNFTLRVTQDTLKGLSALIAILLVITFTSITIKNNSSWAHAGTEVKALRKQVYSCIENNNAGKTVALLNLPNKYKGAHMIYNGAMMQVLLTPPLSPTNVQNNLLTFEPAMYGDSDLVRVSRLRNLVEKEPKIPIYKWDRNSLNLTKLDLTSDENVNYQTQLENPISMSSDAACLSPPVNISALSTDLVEVDLAIEKRKFKKGEKKDSQMKVPLIFYWLSPSNNRINRYEFLSSMIDLSKAKQSIRFNTSQHKKWIQATKINRVAFASGPTAHSIKIDSLRCSRALSLLPDLNISKGNLEVDSRGVINIGKDIDYIELDFDATKVKGAVKCLIEISKPNSWFEHYSGTFRDTKISEHSLSSYPFSSTKATSYKLTLSELKMSGFYQVRIVALDSNGKTTGFFSDPLVLQVTR